MDCTRMYEEFVMLKMNESFQQWLNFFMKCVSTFFEFWHLHNDIHQTFTYIHNNPFFIKAWRGHNIGQVKCVHLGKWKEVAEEHAND
jgi:hypothetical protein